MVLQEFISLVCLVPFFAPCLPTEKAAKRLERVLTADPAMGVFRHVDAGYEDAQKTAEDRGVNIPKL